MDDNHFNPIKTILITVSVLAVITGGLLIFAHCSSQSREKANTGEIGLTTPATEKNTKPVQTEDLGVKVETTIIPAITNMPGNMTESENTITEVTKCPENVPDSESKIEPEDMIIPEITSLPETAVLPTNQPEPTAAEEMKATIEPTPTPFPTPSTVAEIISLVPDFAPDAVTLCLTGDLMCLAGQQFSSEVKGGGHDYTGSYAYIRDYLEAHDLAIGNLETIMSPSNPYSTAAKTVNDQPNCNAPADYLASVKFAGFDALVTANNHCLDGGAIGVKETIENLDSYEFPHVGTYNGSKKNKHYILLQAKEMTIGLIAVTELLNQRASINAAELSNYVDTYDEKFISEQIQNAREAGADFVVVYEHWGSENTHEVRDYQKSHAKFIANAGADLIIGSHPHCLQPYTVIKTEDGREVPCVYSMGNLVSSMTRDINHDTLLLSVAIRKTRETVEIDSIHALPCHVLDSHNGAARVIMPIGYRLNDTKKTTELNEAFGRIKALFPDFF